EVVVENIRHRSDEANGTRSFLVSDLFGRREIIGWTGNTAYRRSKDSIVLDESQKVHGRYNFYVSTDPLTMVPAVEANVDSSFMLTMYKDALPREVPLRQAIVHLA